MLRAVRSPREAQGHFRAELLTGFPKYGKAARTCVRAAFFHAAALGIAQGVQETASARTSGFVQSSSR
jgi:hypothetical protein